MTNENQKISNGLNIQKIKNVLLVISLIIVLFSPILGAQLSFYISGVFIVISAIYMMTKKNLTLKNDRITVLFLFSMLVAIATAFSLRYFI